MKYMKNEVTTGGVRKQTTFLAGRMNEKILMNGFGFECRRFIVITDPIGL